MSNTLQTILNDCLYFVHRHVPQPCLLCGASVRAAQLCTGCLDDLPRLPPECCPQCALPSPGGVLCGRCLRHAPAFDRTAAAYAYDFPLDALVRHCKYQGALELTELFAESIARQVQGQDDVDVLLPMPLHPVRLGERGFNQAAEIARRLSRRLNIPWSAEACTRVRDTPPQAGLDLRQRRRNLRGAFCCQQPLTGRHVALVDDVMTSGASLDALARAVKQAGAARISAWVVARTL